MPSKRHHLYVLVILGLAVILSASKCQTEGPCDEWAIATDRTSLDGCGMLLQTEDRLLLAANLGDLELDLQDGDSVSISYDVIEDAMSICMAEDATVMLRCAVVLSQAPCEPFREPGQEDWSRELLRTMDPTRISFITTAGQAYYRFEKGTDCRLYTCSGREVCRGTCDENDACVTYFADLGMKVTETRVIYVLDQ